MSPSSSADQQARGQRWPLHLADTMVSQIRRGIQDFIGAARPRSPIPSCRRRSRKAARTRSANASAATSAVRANNEAVHLRCTQNPTMGEEWRMGWHPEIITPRHARESVLVVGGGPAGLEASHWHLPGAAMT
jgi:dimethylamine/trimethylamine dehydrogenase